MKTKVKFYCVYLIVYNDYCKIGWTLNIDDRLKSINNGFPPGCKAILHHLVKAENKQTALLIERWTHFELKTYHTGKGEWFHVPLDYAKEILEDVANDLPSDNPEWWAAPLRAVGNEEKRREGVLCMWKDPEFYEKITQAQSNSWKDPILKEKMNAHVKTDKFRKSVSEQSIKNWQNPEIRAKILDAKSKVVRVYSEETRERLRLKALAQWHGDPEQKLRKKVVKR
jgi:hypothetical protein